MTPRVPEDPLMRADAPAEALVVDSAGEGGDARPAPSSAEVTAPPTAHRTAHDPDESRRAFATIADSDTSESEREALRQRLVEMHLPLVAHLARRFRDRGEPWDDLVQVGTIGLIKSVDRFQIDRGVEFSTYATPTILGEIKRHFRDRGWAIRVPRRLQELRLALAQATSELSQELGRSPTVNELAAKLDLEPAQIIEGMESASAYTAISLDAPEGRDPDGEPVTHRLGVEDESLEIVEYRESLRPLLASLPPRERTIVVLRYFGELTQSQIADRLGISQMHVSRLLARTLAQLREGLAER
jgi:RNA polymerase sigma-B factor